MESYYEKHSYSTNKVPIKHLYHTLGEGRKCNFPNWHNEVEILLFTEGEGIITCNTDTYSVKKGDAVIIYPYCVHNIVHMKSVCSYHCLIIDPKFINDLSFEENNISIIISADGQIRAALQNVLEEMSAQKQYYNNIIQGLLMILIFLFKRNESNPENPPLPDHHLPDIRAAIQYIHTNYNKKITLSELLSLTKMGKSTFCCFFRKTTGYSFIEYLNNIRCEQACALIVTTDVSISECAYRCGFSNMSYFTRKFKEIYHALPSELRENQKIKNNFLLDNSSITV